MVRTTPAGTVRFPLTTKGPAAAAQVVLDAMVPDTFCTLPSSYQITMDCWPRLAPAASKVSTVTVFSPGVSGKLLMFQVRCQGIQEAKAPLTFTLYVSITLACPLRLTVGEVV